MNDLLVLKKIDSFKPLLAAWAECHGGAINFDAIDGGAGSGGTAQQMLDQLCPDRKVFAFEPFPGNHRFFEGLDSRIVLVKKALAEVEKTMNFRVHSVVPEDAEWGRGKYTGYSSVGFLSEQGPEFTNDAQVECVAAEQVIPESSNIGFIKLDLQGGELNALKGMRRILKSTRLMWVEFTNQPGLLEFLSDAGFMVFDTEYFLIGDKSAPALDVFEVSKPAVTLSTGREAWFGFRKTAWKNFAQEFDAAKSNFGMVQTDLVCVNKRYLDEFIQSLALL